MKNLSKLLLPTLLVGGLFAGCNTDEEQTTVPDATFNAGVTGDVNQTHGFTISENTAELQNSNGSEVITCTYTSALNEFSMVAQDQSAAWYLTLAYNGELEPGTYNLTESGYLNPSQSNEAFDGTTGTITIGKVELLQNGSGVGTVTSYSIDGSFSATMETSNTPTETIQVNGTFSGVTIGSIL